LRVAEVIVKVVLVARVARRLRLVLSVSHVGEIEILVPTVDASAERRPVLRETRAARRGRFSGGGGVLYME
jgi:hypothetical protein